MLQSKQLYGISMFLRIIALAILFSLTAASKPPQLSPRDTRVKIDEILRAHVSHHELTTELISRAFVNYLDELDPGKTYFLKEEVLAWIEPSQELLLETLSNVKKENFSNFESIHESIIPAIERRNELEKRIANASLPKNIQTSDFKDLDWAENEEALINRILSIRSLQMDAAEKLDQDIKAQFMQRLEKRRLKHEEELITDSPKTRQNLPLPLSLICQLCSGLSNLLFYPCRGKPIHDPSPAASIWHRGPASR
jgi:carboxyl-terminal processing protease